MRNLIAELENMIAERDEILEIIEKLAEPSRHFPDGKKVGATHIARAMEAVRRLQKLIDQYNEVSDATDGDAPPLKRGR